MSSIGDCPICYEEGLELEALRPCLHCICCKCLQQIRLLCSGTEPRCPLCRGLVLTTRNPKGLVRVCLDSVAQRIGTLSKHQGAKVRSLPWQQRWAVLQRITNKLFLHNLVLEVLLDPSSSSLCPNVVGEVQLLRADLSYADNMVAADFTRLVVFFQSAEGVRALGQLNISAISLLNDEILKPLFLSCPLLHLEVFVARELGRLTGECFASSDTWPKTKDRLHLPDSPRTSSKGSPQGCQTASPQPRRRSAEEARALLRRLSSGGDVDIFEHASSSSSSAPPPVAAPEDELTCPAPAGSWPSLRSLDMSSCPMLQSLAVRAFIMGCAPVNPAVDSWKLRHLRLQDSPNAVDDALLHLLSSIENPPCLEKLVIAGSWRVRSPALVKLLERQPSLRVLDLCRCRGLEGDVVLHAVAKCLKTIGTLILERVPDTSDSGVEALVNSPARRTIFNLSLAASEITDHAIDGLQRRCRRLQRLDVSNCHEVSEKALMWMVNRRHSLKELGVTGCRDVQRNSKFFILQLLEGRGRLQEAQGHDEDDAISNSDDESSEAPSMPWLVRKPAAAT